MTNLTDQMEKLEHNPTLFDVDPEERQANHHIGSGSPRKQQQHQQQQSHSQSTHQPAPHNFGYAIDAELYDEPFQKSGSSSSSASSSSTTSSIVFSAMPGNHLGGEHMGHLPMSGPSGAGYSGAGNASVGSSASAGIALPSGASSSNHSSAGLMHSPKKGDPKDANFNAPTAGTSAATSGKLSAMLLYPALNEVRPHHPD